MRGAKIVRLQIFDDKLRNAKRLNPAGHFVAGVRRVGKQVLFELSAKRKTKPCLWMIAHLRMTGQLIFVAAKTKYDKQHLRAGLATDRGNLLFYDMRRFGTLLISKDLHKLLPQALDPLSGQFTVERLNALLRSCNQEIKPWLLRQDKLAGLGNYLASEILFEARLGPKRRTRWLSNKEVLRLHQATIHVLAKAIENAGTTFSDYRDADGESGSFQDLLSVYGRDAENCRRCPGQIVRIVQQQRATFYCPTCQVTSRGRQKRRRANPKSRQIGSFP